MEIFCALLPKLAGNPALVNVDIAAWDCKRRRATLRACSACAGDYEDPERTAWDEEVAELVDAEDGSADEFPVRQ